MTKRDDDRREVDAWIAEARSNDIEVVALQRMPKAKRTSEGLVGPCPACGGDDRFSINRRKQVFFCRGAEGDDVIGMIQHLDGLDFNHAVEVLTGRPRPDGTQEPESEEKKAARERMIAERKAIAAKRAADEERRKAEATENAAGFFDEAEPVSSSNLAGRYLIGRGLTIAPGWTFDLRYHSCLPYWSFPDGGSGRAKLVGEYGALLAAIRDVRGTFIGVHRTYLSADATKLSPPDGGGAKKILGSAEGGMIRLSKWRPIMAVGEGIETTASWFALGRGPDDVGIAAGISIGNIAGRAKSQIPHPKQPKKRIGSGVPDLTSVAIEFDRRVEEVILLVDGDSDPASTWLAILRAGRRLEAARIRVSLDEAPEGKDFNNLLLEEAEVA